MTAELWAVLITSVVALLGACTAYIKSKMTDSDRAETKLARDKAEQEIRDMVLQHQFAIAALKDQQALTATVVDDLRDACAQLNTSVAKLDTNVENLASAIKDMRK